MPARTPGPWSILRSELATFRIVARRDGLRGALRLRLRHHAGVLELQAALEDAQQRAADLARALAAAEAATAAALAAHRADLAAQAAGLQRALGVHAEAAQRARALGDAELRALTREARLHALVAATEAVLAEELAGRETLVTVILPTFDRPALLARAIGSVRAQAHVHWELLVVDNGGRPQTAAAVAAAAAGDPRVRMLRSEQRGASRARNLALAEARGALIAYVDDDNIMCPLWLRALTAFAARHPERGAFYGARVDDRSPEPARLVHDELSVEVIRHHNVVDTGALGHRREVPVRWPPQAQGLSDWEVVAGLIAAGHMPLPIPARALVYTTSAPARVTRPEGHTARVDHSRAAVRSVLAGLPDHRPEDAPA